ncbi:phosphoribosylglycinamide formyltransferase [Treponema phagedenis]|uniref:Phosphoribosylglycinamide formyltransferase n=1 Tax=Treponema phagedenis TaxID=162 RepID=A0A0B7GRV5_TREPH|nr:phosphoribosylglycinamide formyltransferase [Treponema phagedenis]EFW37713.1 phosphoribosylglycinamide formyltransferase [Treponema phagedenis F0421]NVP24068.1 phosphoribosylglycinamide formyltransferase [Treponema phagedenis]QEJ96212.1 phosphoribosylglycinamide formyltransferase [Treponema phagedenis]QEJ99364.1 phosphoribosylglycinamide formyltransferase [Treponema phagedenis]QEJ99987.1 phosphoribosylglycinamide formyltransferase [Treponema phagedenis]
MKNIAVLISGGGTNLQSLIDAAENKQIAGKIVLVISNKETAYGLERAKKHGIPAVFLSPKGIPNTAYAEKLLEVFDKYAVDLIVLAGWIRKIESKIISRYKNKIINIHPSLIPSFCGKGFYGEHVHKAVLDYGAKVSGATVHFVDEGMDTGAIILQKTVEVMQNDTAESLAQRVLAVEHEILVKAVALFCEGKLNVEGRKTKII